MTQRGLGHTNRWHTARMQEKELLIIAYIDEKPDGTQLVIKDISLQINISEDDVIKIINKLYRMKLIDVVLTRTPRGSQKWVVTKVDKPGFCLGGCGKYLSYTGFCSVTCVKRTSHL